MLTDKLAAQTACTIVRHYRQFKLLLIHPGLPGREHVIDAVRRDPPCPLYYYRPGRQPPGAAQFLREMAHLLGRDMPAASGHLQEALSRAPVDLQGLAGALADDLHALGDQPYLLVLDEYERLAADAETQDLLDALLPQLPPACHLLLNSSTIPPLPWVTLVAQQQVAVVYGSDLRSGSEPNN